MPKPFGSKFGFRIILRKVKAYYLIACTMARKTSMSARLKLISLGLHAKRFLLSLQSASMMTLLLWTLQAIHICLSTSRSAHHYKRRRNWSCLSKLFNGNRHLSQVFRDWSNIKLARWRTLTTWRWLSGYKRTILQHPEATWRTLGDEVHGSGASSHAIPPPTFKPGE